MQSPKGPHKDMECFCKKQLIGAFVTANILKINDICNIIVDIIAPSARQNVGLRTKICNLSPKICITCTSRPIFAAAVRPAAESLPCAAPEGQTRTGRIVESHAADNEKSDMLLSLSGAAPDYPHPTARLFAGPTPNNPRICAPASLFLLSLCGF